MKKQDIEKNRNELFEAIPKLKNVYKKAFNYIFIIKLIFATILPIVGLILMCLYLNNQTNSIFFLILLIIHIILILGNISHFLDFIGDFIFNKSENDYLRKRLRIRTIRDWEKYYDNILMPLYKMKEKKLAIESLAESGILFTKNINFNKISIISYIAIGMELKNKINIFLIFLPIWQFLGGENWRKSRKYFNNELNIEVNNFFNINNFGGRLILEVDHKISFLSKETEERLLKYIKEKKKK